MLCKGASLATVGLRDDVSNLADFLTQALSRFDQVVRWLCAVVGHLLDSVCNQIPSQNV